jgi:hypothetical protein
VETFPLVLAALFPVVNPPGARIQIESNVCSDAGARILSSDSPRLFCFVSVSRLFGPARVNFSPQLHRRERKPAEGFAP